MERGVRLGVRLRVTMGQVQAELAVCVCMRDACVWEMRAVYGRVQRRVCRCSLVFIHIVWVGVLHMHTHARVQRRVWMGVLLLATMAICFGGGMDCSTR